MSILMQGAKRGGRTSSRSEEGFSRWEFTHPFVDQSTKGPPLNQLIFNVKRGFSSGPTFADIYSILSTKVMVQLHRGTIAPPVLSREEPHQVQATAPFSSSKQRRKQ
jgi:hypothetical protein